MSNSDSQKISFDDLNWGRLNLISAQDKAADQHSWKVTFRQDARVVRVACWALPEHGIPHGIDGDVTAALIDRYLTDGSPEDGEMTLSVSELMKLAGFHRNGKYRELLMVSLLRLHTTSYEIAGGWRDHPNRRWTTARFHFIELLEYTHQGEVGRFDERTMLRIRLADPLVSSLRSGYTKPLNIEFMQSLSRPRTRIIFRLLDAMRYNPEQPDEITDTYESGLLEWAEQCKFTTNRPDKILRALEEPHQELMRRGYLLDVVITGRGKERKIRYIFSPEFTPISPALLQRFRKHGVNDGVARKLAREFTTQILLGRIELFEQLVRSGQLVIKKTAAAALVHLIKHPDQYQQPPALQPVREELRKPPRVPEEPEVSWEQELTSLTPELAATYTVKRISLLFPKRFKVAELDGLAEMIRQGQLVPVDVVRQAYQHLARIEAQVFVDNLKAVLSQSEQRDTLTS